MDCSTIHCSRCAGKKACGDLLGDLAPRAVTSLQAGTVVVLRMIYSILSSSVAVATVFLTLVALTSAPLGLFQGGLSSLKRAGSYSVGVCCLTFVRFPCRRTKILLRVFSKSEDWL